MPLFYLLSQIFLVDNLFLSFYQSILKQSIGIPMDTYWVIFLATTSCPIGLIVQIILLGLILVLQEGLQIICLFLRTLISSTSWIQSKTLLVLAHAQSHFVCLVVLLMVSPAISWIQLNPKIAQLNYWHFSQVFSARICRFQHGLCALLIPVQFLPNLELSIVIFIVLKTL